ncbi:MAG: TrkH family potassium uptake protein [Pseudomonadota bacterium]
MVDIRKFFRSPARATLAGFALLIAAGTGLLMLPLSTTAGSIGFIDALFTATSAVCVTGLTVVDTGSTFSLEGQIILLVLIECGGLGIMLMSTLLIITAGKRLNFASHHAIQEAFTIKGSQPIPALIRDIVFFTLGAEVLGILVMLPAFYQSHGLAYGAYLSLFHSVSAFCNAGFSLYPDSFSRYVTNPVLNLTICALIVIGGIGFPVLSELKFRLFRKTLSWRRLSLHSKLVLSSTALLIIVSTGAFLVMEWHNTLRTLPLQGKWLAAFFQAINTRTAGFNTVNIDALANETQFFMIILMFIGASPGSCGGGIKTTTFAILTIMGLSRLRGHSLPRIFKRTISEISLEKAVSVVLISMIIICSGLLILLMTEIGDIPRPESRGKFLELLFEVVSAFGTVGLSTGVTATLSQAGKAFITGIMFIGRLGPMVVVIAMSRGIHANYHYAREEAMIG